MDGQPLSALQRVFADAIRRVEPYSRDEGSRAAALVSPSHRGMTPDERVEVYRDQFWIRHRANVAEDFPTLAWVVGAPMAELVDGYVQAHPPRTWDLQRLGADMIRFIEGNPRWSAVPHAVDAARLDWAFMEVFDAADGAPLDPATIAAVPEDAWPSAKLVLQPALRLLRLGATLHDVRAALKRADPVPTLEEGACAVVVWRDAACFPRSIALEPAAHALLVALAAGETLGVACAAAAGDGGADVEGSLGRWFQEWTERAWITRVVV